MSKVSTAMVKPILESMYSLRSEMVPCFIGAPGIGKTQGIYEFAQEKGVNVVTYILSNTVPSEVSGIRMPDMDTKRLEVFDDARMASLKDGDILFFDEILEAPPMLWSACLTLIQDRIMASGRKLPDVFIVAASNPVASPGIIPASTRDRFQFIELEFDKDHWCEWFDCKFNVRPDKLSSKIRSDSDQYNIFTPRRATKLFEWLKNEDEYDQIKKIVIDAMFDNVITNELDKLAKMKASPQRQIVNAIMDSNLPVGVNGIESMSMKEVMEYLSSLPEWEEIQAILSSVEFESDEEE